MLESMKDLDDLSDEEEVEVITIEDSEDEKMEVVEEHSRKRPRQEEGGEERRVVARGEPSRRPPAVPLYYTVQGSPVKACSSDLLLSCLSFLADVRSYGRLRGVCKAWAPLAEHEALWRPLAQELCMPFLLPGHRSSCGQSGKARRSSVGDADEAAPSDKGPTQPPQKAEEIGSPPGAGPHKPPSWMCGACGLIQVGFW